MYSAASEAPMCLLQQESGIPNVNHDIPGLHIGKRNLYLLHFSAGDNQLVIMAGVVMMCSTYLRAAESFFNLIHLTCCCRVETAPGILDPMSNPETELVPPRTRASPPSTATAKTAMPPQDLKQVAGDGYNHTAPASLSGTPFEAANGAPVSQQNLLCTLACISNLLTKSCGLSVDDSYMFCPLKK